MVSGGGGGSGSPTAQHVTAAPIIISVELQQLDERGKHTKTNPKRNVSHTSHGRQEQQGQEDDKDQLLPAALWRQGTAFTTPDSRCTVHPDGEPSEGHWTRCWSLCVCIQLNP